MGVNRPSLPYALRGPVSRERIRPLRRGIVPLVLGLACAAMAAADCGTFECESTGDGVACRCIHDPGLIPCSDVSDCLARCPAP